MNLDLLKEQIKLLAEDLLKKTGVAIAARKEAILQFEDALKRESLGDVAEAAVKEFGLSNQIMEAQQQLLLIVGSKVPSNAP